MKDYKQEFEYLRQGQKIYDDPTIYINITSKNKSDAPDGCENWFVMINVPSNTGQDWDNLILKQDNLFVESYLNSWG